MKLPCVVLLGLLVATGSARAQSLLVTAKRENPPEMGTLHYLELQCADATFTLVPTTSWRMQADGALARLQFSSRTGTVAMLIQFATNDAPAVLTSAEALRQFAAPQLSDATVLDEFPAYGSNLAGKGVDLGYSMHGRQMRCRAAVLAFTGGCVRFVLTCGANEFADAERRFSGMLASLQQTSRGAANGRAHAAR